MGLDISDKGFQNVQILLCEKVVLLPHGNIIDLFELKVFANLLTLKAPLMTIVAFADNVDQDQAAQNVQHLVQPDL